MKFAKITGVFVSTFLAAFLLLSPTARGQEVPNSQSNVLTLDEVGSALAAFGGDAAFELSEVVKTVFSKMGQPSGLIVGDEMQGSFFVGYRKGDGHILFHGNTVEKSPRLRWSAPSLGINVGASLSKVAILVYGAQSAGELKKGAFTSLQGSYHFIGGAGVSYLTNSMGSDSLRPISLVYISVGLGLDAGVAVERLSFK